jgi:Mg-chelatase subunit ChlD
MKSIKTILWTAVACALLTGRAFAQTAEDKIRQETADATATAYTVIFDNSGSMNGLDGTRSTRIAKARNAFNWWLSSIKPGNFWSGITFSANNDARLLLPFTKNGQNQIAAEINQLEANTNTPIVKALTLASQGVVEQRKTQPYRRYVVLLFTDGEENVDRRGNRGVTAMLHHMTEQLSIEVIAIGFSSDAGDYLKDGSSKYFHADDEAGIKAGLSQVESEIDPNTPVNVSPEELKQLAHPIIARSVTPASQPPPAAQAPNTDLGILKIAGIIVLVFIGIGIAARRR